MKYRNELKFMVSDLDIERIRYRLSPLMEQDVHQGAYGYTVRSVYFDDIYNSYLSENMSGVDNRKKFRLRLYNGDIGMIRLEKKSKYRGMTGKVVQRLSREECKLVLDGDLEKLNEKISSGENLLLKEVYFEILRKKLEPKCIVEYERFAFVEKMGNVRITFDKNISGSKQTQRFFDTEMDYMPVMPCGWHVLEIKYDELLPHYILQAIDIGTLRRQSYSKYYTVRQTVG